MCFIMESKVDDEKPKVDVETKDTWTITIEGEALAALRMMAVGGELRDALSSVIGVGKTVFLAIKGGDEVVIVGRSKKIIWPKGKW
jgi:RIO-like serine/threonine protein kinase